MLNAEEEEEPARENESRPVREKEQEERAVSRKSREESISRRRK